MAKRSASAANDGSWWAQEKPEDVFTSLLGNISSKEFFAKHWEKEPLIIRKDKAQREGDLTKLFSRECLERILKKERIDFGLHINSCKYANGKREDKNPEENPEAGEPVRATVKKVKALFDGERATLQFHQPQQFQDSVWRLCAALESHFGCLVGSNVYMTPGESQGLAPHHDDVEVFIIQLEGRKHWQLFAPQDKLARSCSDDLSADSIGKPTHDITLEAGDVMYFPRGTIHQADTPAGVAHSTHITISTFQNWTYGDLLQAAIPLALEEALNDKSALDFKQGLPLNLLSAAGTAQVSKVDQRCASAVDEVKKTLGKLVQQLAGYMTPAPAVDAFNADFLRSRLPPPPASSVSDDQIADAPAAKRKKNKGQKEDVDLVDLTSDNSFGDPVGPKPTSTSKVCLLHRNHIRVIVGEGLEDEEEAEGLGGLGMMDGMDDDDSEEDDADMPDDDEDDDDDDEDFKKAAKALLTGNGGGGDSEDDDDDSMNGSGAEEDGCFVHFDFTNIRRLHMTNIMAVKPPLSSVRLPMSAVPALGKLLAKLTPIALSDLGLEGDDALDLATSLWASGLLSAH